MTRFPHTFQLEAVTTGRRKGWRPRFGLDTPSPSVSWAPRANEQGGFCSENEWGQLSSWLFIKT